MKTYLDENTLDVSEDMKIKILEEYQYFESGMKKLFYDGGIEPFYSDPGIGLEIGINKNRTPGYLSYHLKFDNIPLAKYGQNLNQPNFMYFGKSGV